MLATPFYDKLIDVCKGAPHSKPYPDYYELLHKALSDEKTKRIMFDSRQAALFDQLHDADRSGTYLTRKGLIVRFV